MTLSADAPGVGAGAHWVSSRRPGWCSLPDEVGSPPRDGRRNDEEKRKEDGEEGSAAGSLGFGAKKMSRNTHAPSLPANGRLTPAGYAGDVMVNIGTQRKGAGQRR